VRQSELFGIFEARPEHDAEKSEAVSVDIMLCLFQSKLVGLDEPD